MARVQVEVGRIFEFVLNFRSAQRGAALPLWCPGAVSAIYKRQFGTAVLKPGQLPYEESARGRVSAINKRQCGTVVFKPDEGSRSEPVAASVVVPHMVTPASFGRSWRDGQDMRSRRWIVSFLDAIERW